MQERLHPLFTTDLMDLLITITGRAKKRVDFWSGINVLNTEKWLQQLNACFLIGLGTLATLFQGFYKCLNLILKFNLKKKKNQLFWASESHFLAVLAFGCSYCTYFCEALQVRQKVSLCLSQISAECFDFCDMGDLVL